MVWYRFEHEPVALQPFDDLVGSGSNEDVAHTFFAVFVKDALAADAVAVAQVCEEPSGSA